MGCGGERGEEERGEWVVGEVGVGEKGVGMAGVGAEGVGACFSCVTGRSQEDRKSATLLPFWDCSRVDSCCDG